MNMTAFVGAQLVGEAHEQGSVQQGNLIIEGTRIVALGASDDVPVPEGAVLWDVAGKTLMPGLVDAHVHTLANAGPSTSDLQSWQYRTPYGEQTVHGIKNLVTALEAGVSTVRDMAGGAPEAAMKRGVQEVGLPTARMVSCGMVGMTGGHADMFFPGLSQRRPWPTADGRDECRKAVRAYARMGHDQIKICTSAGVLSQGDKEGWRNYTDEEIATITDEAHALGMRVSSHAHSQDGIERALRNGVDTIEHASDLTPQLIDLLLETGAIICPTLSIMNFMLSHGPARGVTPDSMSKAASVHSRHVEGIQAAFQAGVPIAGGTDSCITMPFGDHARELELLVEHVGMSSHQALTAMTQTSAEVCGLGDEIGSLAPGKLADFLIVDGNPLADVSILQDKSRILSVWKDGKERVSRWPK